MLCGICVSDHSANTYNLEETMKLFIVLWTSRQQEYLGVRAFHRLYKYSSTHFNLVINSHAGKRHAILSSISGLKNKLESKNWLLKKVLIVPNWNSFSDRNIMTKYPFPHNQIHLQFRWDYTWKGMLEVRTVGWSQREACRSMLCEFKWKKMLWFLRSQGEKTMLFKMHKVLNHEVLVICFP